MEKKSKAFGLSDKMGYMFGDFGNDFTFLLSTIFLMKFYTDIMGVSAAIVGAMIMLARFWMHLRMWLWGRLQTEANREEKGSSCHGYGE